jgi:hypothetical protein
MYGHYEPRDLQLKNNMSTVVVLLVIEKALNATWQPGLLYN